MGATTVNGCRAIVGLFLFLFAPCVMALPKGFVYLDEIAPSIVQEIRYFGSNNFIGRPIQGYQAPRCILTREAALALLKVQQALQVLKLGLKVYDGYRPQSAVNDFIAWSRDAADQKMKLDYYPRVDKADFFRLGYVSAKSGHTRGSTVDLTLVAQGAGGELVELDMGTPFDFLDETSHSLTTVVSSEAHQNRLLLRGLMKAAGFLPLTTEWWHFTLKHEPFPDTYFDFPVSD